MKRLNQKGFSAIEALIIVLILAVIGFVSWRVLDSKKATNTNSTTTRKSTETKKLDDQQAAIQKAKEYKPEGACTDALTPAIHKASGAEYTFPSGCLAPGWEPKVNESKYLIVKEWGIKIPLDSSVAGLAYTTGSDKLASFRSTALNDVSSDCSSNSVDVARGKATEVVPNEADSPDGANFLTTYNNASLDPFTTRSIKAKVGDYYLVVPGYAGASCATEANQAKEGEAMIAIIKAVNKAVAQ